MTYRWQNYLFSAVETSFHEFLCKEWKVERFVLQANNFSDVSFFLFLLFKLLLKKIRYNLSQCLCISAGIHYIYWISFNILLAKSLAASYTFSIIATFFLMLVSFCISYSLCLTNSFMYLHIQYISLSDDIKKTLNSDRISAEMLI